MHLADAFIQSDLHCIQVTVFFFYFCQLLLSLGKQELTKSSKEQHLFEMDFTVFTVNLMRPC